MFKKKCLPNNIFDWQFTKRSHVDVHHRVESGHEQEGCHRYIAEWGNNNKSGSEFCLIEENQHCRNVLSLNEWHRHRAALCTSTRVLWMKPNTQLGDCGSGCMRYTALGANGQQFKIDCDDLLSTMIYVCGLTYLLWQKFSQNFYITEHRQQYRVLLRANRIEFFKERCSNFAEPLSKLMVFNWNIKCMKCSYIYFKSRWMKLVGEMCVGFVDESA